MLRNIATFLTAAACLVSTAASAADVKAKSIVESMLAKQAQREAATPFYLVRESHSLLGNQEMLLLYGRPCAPERTFTITSEPDDYVCDASTPGYTVVRPDEIEYMLGGTDHMLKNQAGLLATSKVVPTLHPFVDPQDLADMSEIMRIYSQNPRLFNQIEQEDAKQARIDMRRFARMARHLGNITLHGREAFILIAGNTGVSGNTEDEMHDLYNLLTSDELIANEKHAADYKIQTIMLAIDSERLVPLALGVWGTTKQNKKKEQNFQVFREDRDYFKVTDTQLYIPKTTTMAMRMKLNVGDEKQQKELEKALKDYEKAKAELEAMKQAQAAAGGVLGDFMNEQMAKMEEMVKMMEVAAADDAVEDAEINLKTIQGIFDGGLVGNVRTNHAATGGTTEELAQVAIMPFLKHD